MADPISEFFDSLSCDGARQLTGHKTTMRVDLEHFGATEHWLLEVEGGHIHVSRKNASADATLRMGKETFDRLVRGGANPVAAMLRGLIQPHGDAELIMWFQGLFPAPAAPGARGVGSKGAALT